MHFLGGQLHQIDSGIAGRIVDRIQHAVLGRSGNQLEAEERPVGGRGCDNGGSVAAAVEIQGPYAVVALVLGMVGKGHLLLIRQHGEVAVAYAVLALRELKAHQAQRLIIGNHAHVRAMIHTVVTGQAVIVEVQGRLRFGSLISRNGHLHAHVHAHEVGVLIAGVDIHDKLQVALLVDAAGLLNRVIHRR